MLGKLAFRFLLLPSFVGQFFRLRYGWQGNPWELPVSSRPSEVWRLLCAGLRLVRSHVRRLPGTLHDIDLMRDPWFSTIPFSRIPICMDQMHFYLGYCLSQVVSNGQWMIQEIRGIFPVYWADCILKSTPPQQREGGAFWCWEDSPSGSPTTRQIAQVLRPQSSKREPKLGRGPVH
ncbi:hypothetical protein QJS10_CPA09g00567 [Acorus calamus]|uniref:Secreted protein n=1 Tax=Acorus calamus TaxID=4465 RepID=A0AAV9EA99_ACOCL|nr:hypothetical protein QJS10_CPA09g00567 [Acorus calamus]